MNSLLSEDEPQMAVDRQALRRGLNSPCLRVVDLCLRVFFSHLCLSLTFSAACEKMNGVHLNNSLIVFLLIYQLLAYCAVTIQV